MMPFIRLLVAVPLCVMSASHEVYVSCSVGSDENPGTAAKPFRTLHAARDALRAARFLASNWTSAEAAEVHVLVDATSSDADAGRCEVAKPLELDERDSNVQWISDGGLLLLSGGVRLDPSSFTPSSTDNVVSVDLRKHGIRDFGKLRGRGYAGGSGCIKTQNYEPSALEFFYRDAKKTVSEERQMVLARYPDLTHPVAKGNWMQVGSVSGNHIAVPSLAGRMRKWHNETVWAHGLWKWNWADSHRPVLAYNASTGSLKVGDDDDADADVSLSRGGNFYVYNVRAELDRPGEYYVNSETGILEFLPPQIAGQPENATYHVSLSTSILHVMGASDVTFEGFEFRYTRGPGVVVENSTRVTFKKCEFGDIGMMALNVTGGSMCGLHSSIVEGAGDGGVVLNGGDRKLLTPAGHFVSNTSLHHNQRWIMNYAPHVLLAGVGNSIRDSELFNAPQIAVFMQGNDHALLSSYIHDAAQQCSDCGAFYMGREWTYRGNIIDGNTWRRISSLFGGPFFAVYLDDMLSSVNITNNIFDDVKTVLELGGGRHNVFTGNFINSSSNQPVNFDARGLNWAKKGCKAGGILYEFLAQVPYKSDPWKKYPGLANILNDFPCEPRHNVISNNVMCHGATTLINQKAATITAWHSIAENNTVCKSFTSLTAEELFV